MNCSECSNHDCLSQGRLKEAYSCKRHLTGEEWLSQKLAEAEQRIAALEAANAKQAARIVELEDEREKLEKQEPICYIGMWALSDLDIGNIVGVSKAKEPDDMPLYARPVPARTLTDDVIRELRTSEEGQCDYKFARAIEAWLKGGE